MRLLNRSPNLCYNCQMFFLQIANAYIRVYETMDANSCFKFDIRLSMYRQ